jgi:hypothetical protein
MKKLVLGGSTVIMCIESKKMQPAVIVLWYDCMIGYRSGGGQSLRRRNAVWLLVVSLWIILLDLDVLRIGPRCVNFADWT